MLRRLAEKLWSASRKESRIARTVVLKLKTSEFKILTRSLTPDSPPSSCEELTTIALKLREKVDLGPNERYRLVGVGLSNFARPSKRPRSHLFSSDGQWHFVENHSRANRRLFSTTAAILLLAEGPRVKQRRVANRRTTQDLCLLPVTLRPLRILGPTWVC